MISEPSRNIICLFNAQQVLYHHLRRAVVGAWHGQGADGVLDHAPGGYVGSGRGLCGGRRVGDGEACAGGVQSNGLAADAGAHSAKLQCDSVAGRLLPTPGAAVEKFDASCVRKPWVLLACARSAPEWAHMHQEGGARTSSANVLEAADVRV